MGSTLKTYLLECFLATYTAWHRHEGATVVLGAVLSLVAAIITVFLFPLKFADDAVNTISASLGAWFIFYFAVVSPYMLWKKQTQRINELEDNLRPKLEIGCRVSPDKSFGELIVRNASSKTIHGLSVVLANTRKKSGVFIKDTNYLMSSNEGQKCPLSLDPNSLLYFQFSSRGPKKGDRQSIQLYSGKNVQTNYFDGNSLVVKFNISATDLLRIPYLILVQLENSDGISLANWERNKA